MSFTRTSAVPSPPPHAVNMWDHQPSPLVASRGEGQAVQIPGRHRARYPRAEKENKPCSWPLGGERAREREREEVVVPEQS